MLDKNILKNGDILLVHNKEFSLFSWGIRLLTNSYWNHVSMVAIDLTGKIYATEALPNGVVATPIEKYIDNGTVDLRVIQLKPEAFKDEDEYKKGLIIAIGRMRQAIGTKYDWWAIVWLAIKYIGRGAWNKGAKYVPQRFNPFQSRYKVFCSELVCQCCFNISSINPYLFQGEAKQDCSSTTPKDIGKSRWVKHIWGKDVV